MPLQSYYKSLIHIIVFFMLNLKWREFHYLLLLYIFSVNNSETAEKFTEKKLYVSAPLI